MRKRFSDLMFLHQCITKSCMRFGIVRMDRQRLSKFGDGLVEAALLEQRAAKVEMAVGIIGSQSDCLFIMPNRFVELIFSHERVAEIIVNQSVAQIVTRSLSARTNSERSFILLDGVINPAVLGEKLTKIVARDVIVRCHCQRVCPKRFTILPKLSLIPRTVREHQNDHRAEANAECRMSPSELNVER